MAFTKVLCLVTFRFILSGCPYGLVVNAFSEFHPPQPNLEFLYSEARQVRTLQGPEAARDLYQSILERNPKDRTAATWIAASKNENFHDRLGKAGDRSERKAFVSALRSIGYEKDSIADLCVSQSQNANQKAKASSSPIYLKPLGAGSQTPPLPTCSLGACIQLFLMGVCIPTETCRDLLGTELVNLMENLGLAKNVSIYSEGGGHQDDVFETEPPTAILIPYAHIFPVQVGTKTLYFATDLHPAVLSRTEVNGCGAVMYIGPDSLALVDHWSSFQTPRQHETILDVGCGSGIQALSLIAQSSGTVSENLQPKTICVDINARALLITQLNFEWNGFEPPELLLGDIIHNPLGKRIRTSKIGIEEDGERPWMEIIGGPVNYILSNPPFLPVPVHDEAISLRYGLFSSGGSTGEEFLEALIRLASKVLSDERNSTSTLAVVSEFMNPNVEFGRRLSSWWSSGSSQFPPNTAGAHALFLTNEAAIDASEYALRRADSLSEAHRWKGHLEDHRIDFISPGLLFLQRTNDTDGILNLKQALVPKSSDGSIWTPTNQKGRDFTRRHIDQFFSARN